ncbi:Gluconate transport-inducing protein [Trachipleistophora hominis]|uniref:Gluconate transport-inducing protein n=1 Tax=Trachipleistophora hominis TaxID=72359 RepID=L7JSZ9_TRAHO|nr:Gluconate transport-inducing protein [Trachipleistophora hominis]
MINHESYFGCMHKLSHYLSLFQLAVNHEVPTLKRRLSDTEKNAVRAGSTYIYSENESGIRRWTDHLSWTPSRASNECVFYQEIANHNQPMLKKVVTATIDKCKWHIVNYSTVSDEITGTCCAKYQAVYDVPITHNIVVKTKVRCSRNTLRKSLSRNYVRNNAKKIYSFVDESNLYGRRMDVKLLANQNHLYRRKSEESVNDENEECDTFDYKRSCYD